MFAFKKRLFTLALLTTTIVVTMLSCSLKFPNNVASIQQNSNGTLPAPILTPTSLNSTDNDSVTVSMSLDPSSPIETQIYYTNDGTDPATSLTAVEYVLPLTLTSSQGTISLRAIAKTETDISSEATGSYWFGDWEFVGASYPAPPASGISGAIFVENNIPYIAHKGVAASTFEVEKLVNGVWTLYPAISGCNAWYGGNESSYLFVESGTPYIACYKSGASAGLYIKQYSSGAWSNIGSTIPYSPLEVYLYVENGTPYIAMIDSSGWGIYTYYYDGSAWTQIGLSPGKGTRVFLRVKDSTPYVGFVDMSSGLLKFKKFDGFSWIDLGTMGAVTPFPAYDFDFAVYDDGSTDGVVYALYQSTDFHLKKYENGSWSDLPEAVGVSGTFLTLNVKDDIPYVSYQSGLKALITRLYDGVWSAVGTTPYYANTGTPDSFIAEDGTVYMYYGVYVVVSPSIGIVESFGPGGSGIPAHVNDPVLLVNP